MSANANYRETHLEAILGKASSCGATDQVLVSGGVTSRVGWPCGHQTQIQACQLSEGKSRYFQYWRQQVPTCRTRQLYISGFVHSICWNSC